MTDQQPIADKESKQQAAGIVSYCIEYASSQGDKCTECRKRIIKGSLRAGEIHRKSKSEKKNKAERTWWHFNCWKVPERLTIVPIEQFRGYLKLKEKDQKRVKRVIDSGVGATWSSINAKPAEEIEEELLEADESPKKSKNKKNKKQQARSDDIDMTSKLTGVTTTDTNKNNKKKQQQEAGKKRKRTEDVLGEEGQNELQSIAKEIQALRKKQKQ